MSKKYGKLMSDFFNSLDPVSRCRPANIALEFAKYYWIREIVPSEPMASRFISYDERSRSDAIGLDEETDALHNIGILTEDVNLDFITKRASIVSDSAVFSHFHNKKKIFFHKDFKQPRVDEDSITSSFDCPNLNELGAWLEACKPLLVEGVIFYLPSIHMNFRVYSLYSGNYAAPSVNETERVTSKVYDFIVKNKKLIVPDKSLKTMNSIVENKTKTLLFRPILAIDIPFIDTVSLIDFAKISADEGESLQRFRDFLRAQLFELGKKENDEYYDSELEKFSIELRDGVRKLKSDYMALNRKSVFHAIGATAAAFTAFLVAINSNAFGMLPGILGAGGGILGFSKVLEEYLSERHKMSNNNFYYLWLLSRKTFRLD
jgi:hypothetical protein